MENLNKQKWKQTKMKTNINRTKQKWKQTKIGGESTIKIKVQTERGNKRLKQKKEKSEQKRNQKNMEKSMPEKKSHS